MTKQGELFRDDPPPPHLTRENQLLWASTSGESQGVVRSLLRQLSIAGGENERLRESLSPTHRIEPRKNDAQ